MTCCERHAFVRRPDPDEALRQHELQRQMYHLITLHPVRTADDDRGER